MPVKYSYRYTEKFRTSLQSNLTLCDITNLSSQIS